MTKTLEFGVVGQTLMFRYRQMKMGLSAYDFAIGETIKVMTEYGPYEGRVVSIQQDWVEVKVQTKTAYSR